jgi:hypothetical protein
VRVLASLILLLVGCGGDQDWCSPDMSHYGQGPCNCCYAAQLFAARDTPSLVPSVDEVEVYADRWSRAVDAEPILNGRIPQAYRDNPPTMLHITTTNPSVIAAWRERKIVTGDAGFDAIVQQLAPSEVGKQFGQRGGPEWYFELDVGNAHNEDRLDQTLLAFDTSLSDPQQLPRDDGHWSWSGGPTSDEATATIDFTFGWGDCFVACDGFHSVRAVVPPTGAATVYDLGGDPLPDGMSLSPNTRPLP